MNKVLVGLLLGAVLGAVDGGTAWFTPEVRPEMAMIIVGSTFKGLVGVDAVIRRGEGERQKEAKVSDFRQAMAWLMAQAESAVGRQRYKGLGEMNPQQLWETTMDPGVRRLLKVQIDDAIEADRVFTMLMGDEVEPRREFIESNALRAANIDV